MASFNNSFGVLFVEAFIATALWGMSTTQVLHYFFTRSRDPGYIKALVVGVCLVDTVHQIIVMTTVADPTVAHAGDTAYIQLAPRSILAQEILLELNVVMVQSFYIYRILRLSRNRRWIPWSIGVFTAAHFVVACVDSARIAEPRTVIGALTTKDRTAMTVAAYILVVVADLLVAATMSFILRSNKTEYERTNTILMKIMVFTVSTNLLTSITSIAAMLITLLMPTSMLSIAIFQLIPRLYTNSFMAALNMRPFFANRPAQRSQSPRRHEFELAVRVNTTVFSAHDGDRDEMKVRHVV